jgi:hypothetical protein
MDNYGVLTIVVSRETGDGRRELGKLQADEDENSYILFDDSSSRR